MYEQRFLRIMIKNCIDLQVADRLEVTILIDNYVDIMQIQSTNTVRRLPFDPGNVILAEHGLSCLIKIWSGPDLHTVLMDAGLTVHCFFHNADLLSVDLD